MVQNLRAAAMPMTAPLPDGRATALTDRIAEMLREHHPLATCSPHDPIYCSCSPGYNKGVLYREKFPRSQWWVEWTPAHVAEQIEAALTIPDRQFTDEFGHRWEWCGGEPGTWAWRVTANHIAFTQETHNVIDPKWTDWNKRVVGIYHRWVSPWTEDTPNVAHDALQPQETAPQPEREERP